MLSPPRVISYLSPHPCGSGGSFLYWNQLYRGLLVSESHKRGKDGKYHAGGPFFQYTHSLIGEDRRFKAINNGVLWEGPVGSPVLPTTKPALYSPPTWASEQSTLSGHYATGFARARPGNPVASAGQFLVELRDLPTVPLRLLARLKSFRALGSEYLNVAFGWKPFVNDVIKMYNLYRTIDAKLARIVRENGKGVHRKATIKNDTSVTKSPDQYNASFCWRFATYTPQFNANGWSHLSQTVTTTEKVWFVGKFRYYIPDIGSSQWTRRATLALFGAYPTPSLLWEVLPWSWLIDWFTNVGDVISNASTNAVDNLTCEYSYVMRSTKTEKVWTLNTSWDSYSSHGLKPPLYVRDAGKATVSTREIIEKKTRAGGGNPFGLNISLSSLSTYQLSILAALGLSRQRLL